MRVAMILASALAFAPACLAFLLWLSHLEETLPRDVRRAQRHSEPPPILAIPVSRPPRTTVVVPEQRTAPAVELQGTDGVPAT
jgi:hypothetical protein